jgi:voltage-gated potassium channel
MPIFIAVSRLFHVANRYRVLALVALAVMVVVIAATLFSIAEGISFGTALYWSVVTAATVGYGDITPHTTAGHIIAVGVMLTTIPIVGAVFALVAGASALAQIRRMLGMATHLPTQPYTLIYGSHPVVTRVVEELQRAGDPVVLVSPSRPAGIPRDIEHIAGEPADEATVAKSKPERANRALIACTEDTDTLVVAVALHHFAPDLEVYALTQSPRVAKALSELGVTHTLASDELVGHTLAKSLETPQAGGLLLQLVDNETYQLRETPIDGEYLLRPLSHARAASGGLVLGIARGRQVDLGIFDDPVLVEGDRLIVLHPAEHARRRRVEAEMPRV